MPQEKPTSFSYKDAVSTDLSDHLTKTEATPDLNHYSGLHFSNVDQKPSDTPAPTKPVYKAERLAFPGIFESVETSFRIKLEAILTDIYTKAATENLLPSLEYLYTQLNLLRKETHEEIWKSAAKKVILSHPISKIIFRDPCTKHSFDKPRGYPGDAALLDYFYQDTNSTNPIQAYTVTRPSGEALRDRIRIIASRIDEITENAPNSTVLSIACGHLHEAEYSKMVQSKKLSQFLALDHDPETLKKVQEKYSSLNITTQELSVFSLIKGHSHFQENSFNFVYAAGLYDYLSPRMAQKLTSIMFKLLKPGGYLLVSNFVHDTVDRGYMETFMDWFLIYREFPEMETLSQDIPFEHMKRKTLFRGGNNTILYLEIQKKD
ncbi:MAG: class I SAM-dependent methyltransferase [Candidatus Margulisiibacteriota bacterium]